MLVAAVVFVSSALTVTAAVAASGSPTLTVSLSGDGQVTASDSSIDCPPTCSQGYKPGDKVTLSAKPTTGWTFIAWSGDCSGSGDCVVTMDADHSVTASFLYSGVSDLSATTAEVFADGGAAGTAEVTPTALAGNKPPQALISAPSRIQAGRVVTLDARKSSDPDGKVMGYRWDLNGDKVYGDAFGPLASFRGALAGSRTISLQVIDDKGRIGGSTRTIRVVGKGGVPDVAALVAASGHATRLTGGFTKGYAGWRRRGAAFPDRVQHAGWISASQVLDTAGRLGGSYASRIPVRMGASAGWVTSFHPLPHLVGLSADTAGALATGVLASDPFVVSKRYLNLRLGGGGTFGSGAERVEIWVKGRSGWKRDSRSIRTAGDQEVLRPVSLDLHDVKGSVAVIAIVDDSATGWVNVDQVALSDSRGRIARDASYFRLPPSQRAVSNAPPPIVGFADFHSHPAAAQGFGALQGIRAYMGTVGGDVSAYDSHPETFVHDVYADDVYHFGGPLAKFGLDLSEGRVARSDSGAALLSLIGFHAHPRYGGPCTGAGLGACDDAQHQPGTIGPAHQQMNVWEIHRAWEGGLRLMSSLSINSTVLEYLAGFPVNRTGGAAETDLFGAPTEYSGDHSVNHVDVTPEASVIQAQVEGMRQLAQLNHSWMQIAYNPQQAYDIMRLGKLAIILGTEIDTTGSLGFGSAQGEVNWLWGLGIRQVTPIHCCDSRIGGSALFQDAYNVANDLAHRPRKDITALRAIADIADQGLGIAPKPGFTGTPQVGYFLHARAGCAYPNNLRGECVNWRFDTPNGPGTVDSPFGNQAMAVVDGTALTEVLGHVGYTVHPAPFDRIPSDLYGFYDNVQGGMDNPQGLTAYGRNYIEALMQRGMLIDMEHMSEQTINDVIDPGTAAGHVRGPVWSLDNGATCNVRVGFNNPVSARDCWSHAYPLMSSHTSFRAQSLLPTETLFKGFVSREFERSPDQIEYIHRSGGVLGPVVLQDPVDTISQHVSSSVYPTWQFVDHHDWQTTSHPPNSCAGSSESWAQAYLYGLQKMGGAGVGVGTDMLLVGGTSARFGASAPEQLGSPYSCNDSREAGDNRPAEENFASSQYQRSAQTNPIDYGAAFGGYSPGSPVLRPELDPAGVTKNFNDIGMQVYGQLPDLLQDLTNIGVTAHDLSPLFSSAQDYVMMWSKAYVLAQCYGSRFDSCGGAPTALDAASVCRNTCPMDPGRGLDLAPDGSAYVLESPATN